MLFAFTLTYLLKSKGNRWTLANEIAARALAPPTTEGTKELGFCLFLKAE